MSLRHVAIPSWPSAHIAPRFPAYAMATRVQSMLQADLLAWKKADPDKRPNPLPPTLISLTPAPTYTRGRRQTEELPSEDWRRLRAPLFVSGSGDERFYFKPHILTAPRGGLMTYHGPGQVMLWPVIDLISPLHTHFSVRDYTSLLEQTTIATLRKLHGVEAFTTSNPGVWVHPQGAVEGTEHKIAALGVHLQRHVSGLGVAINVGMPVAGPEDTNPWARIEACGLADKGVTSLTAHLGLPEPLDGADIAPAWAAEFAARLGIPAVEPDDWAKWENGLDMSEPYLMGTAKDSGVGTCVAVQDPI
ncbi:hypothetical protein GGR54DRAFT_342470 [Hypoxylon sp. NC1633]|nr:hypothetical protein GGR54DRAFT_342470 [Hypoxylon sp. NC1633]